MFVRNYDICDGFVSIYVTVVIYIYIYIAVEIVIEIGVNFFKLVEIIFLVYKIQIIMILCVMPIRRQKHSNCISYFS